MTKEISSPFESIRRAAADIVLNSTDLLTVRSDIVTCELAKNLEEFRNKRTGNSLSAPILNAEDELGLCLFFNSVNFCYRDPYSGWEYEYISHDGRRLKRSSALFAVLAESGLRWNHIDQVLGLAPDHWREILQLEEPNVLYLGMERCKRIAGLAGFLQKRNLNTVMDLIITSQNEVLNLIRILISSGFFKDEFLKRAQVAIKMMNSVLATRMGYSLNGMNLLTCMADYRIPQVFYNLGAVDLTPGLRAHLESGKQIVSGSREEVALRATVIVIGRQLAEQMLMDEADVDTLLWEYSQVMDKNGQMRIPHMLVATDKY